MLDPTIYMAKQLADLTDERPPKHKSTDSLKRNKAVKRKKKDRNVTVAVDKDVTDHVDKTPGTPKASKAKARSVSLSQAQNFGYVSETPKADGKAINRTPSNQSLSKMMTGGIRKVTHRLQVNLVSACPKLTYLAIRLN